MELYGTQPLQQIVLHIKVPKSKYLLPIGKAETLREGKDMTLVGWGTQIHVLLEVADMVKEQLGADCEVIDLQSILPWDVPAVAEVVLCPCMEYNICNVQSVVKTGRLVVSHEGMPVKYHFISIFDQIHILLSSSNVRLRGRDRFHHPEGVFPQS